MKRKLIVIDLDKTLLPYDSFQKFVLFWLRMFPITVTFIIIKRKLKVLSAAAFKEKIILLAEKHPRIGEIAASIANGIVRDIDKPLLTRILKKSDGQTSVLLMSASPDLYVSLVGQLLHIESKGSFFDQAQRFRHLHGNGKIDYLKTHYPREKFEYLFAISDCESDQEMLSLFRNFELIKR